MGSLFSSDRWQVGTSYELPDYGELQFHRDMADCKRDLSIIRIEPVTDAQVNKLLSTQRALESRVRGVPPSFRNTLEFSAVAYEMRVLNIPVPVPILYTILRN